MRNPLWNRCLLAIPGYRQRRNSKGVGTWKPKKAYIGTLSSRCRPKIRWRLLNGDTWNSVCSITPSTSITIYHNAKIAGVSDICYMNADSRQSAELAERSMPPLPAWSRTQNAPIVSASTPIHKTPTKNEAQNIDQQTEGVRIFWQGSLGWKPIGRLSKAPQKSARSTETRHYLSHAQFIRWQGEKTRNPRHAIDNSVWYYTIYGDVVGWIDRCQLHHQRHGVRV